MEKRSTVLRRRVIMEIMRLRSRRTRSSIKSSHCIAVWQRAMMPMESSIRISLRTLIILILSRSRSWLIRLIRRPIKLTRLHFRIRRRVRFRIKAQLKSSFRRSMWSIRINSNNSSINNSHSNSHINCNSRVMIINNKNKETFSKTR